MALTAESIREHIPYYLTQETKEGLVRELNNFPDKMLYYLMGKYETEMLQGDGWTRLQLCDLRSGERAFVRGIILSNTCDVAQENSRDLPISIVFAPLIAVENYVRLLQRAGLSQTSIDGKLSAIRQQRITNVFYLPTGAGLTTENIVVLDNIYSMPAKMYDDEVDKNKIFTLSMAGFYLFILKLSMHFCRFHENLIRA